MLGTKKSQDRHKTGPRKPETRRRGQSLAAALFTKTQQRVLGLLFGQPDRSFFATELIALADAGSGAVQRELQRLADSGLVTVTKVGNQKHFQANRESPIFSELHAIVTKTVGLIEPLRAGLSTLKDRIALAIVYGSVAKGADTASSDIDLLIVADDITLEEVYSALAPVEDRLQRKINPTLYTKTEFAERRKAGNPFLRRVLSGDKIALFEAEYAA